MKKKYAASKSDKGEGKSQKARNQMEIKSQGGFRGICSIKLKVCYQPLLCVSVCVCVRKESETCEAFSLDLAMPNPISFWLLPGNITLKGRNGRRKEEG